MGKREREPGAGGKGRVDAALITKNTHWEHSRTYGERRAVSESRRYERKNYTQLYTHTHKKNALCALPLPLSGLAETENRVDIGMRQ